MMTLLWLYVYNKIQSDDKEILMTLFFITILLDFLILIGILSSPLWVEIIDTVL